MIERIQPTLALLDGGLSLYRRHFVSFALLSAAWFVPVAVVSTLAIFFGSQMDALAILLLIIVGLFGLLGLSIYLIAVLSRAAAAAIDGQPLRIGQLLRIGPLQMLGMSVWTIVYLILAQIASSIVSLVVICPLYIFAGVFAVAFAALGSEVGGVLGGLGAVTIFGLVYLLGIFVSGAMYGGMIYGLQPWAHDHAGFGASIQRSIEMLFYRFWRNVGVWGMAAVLLLAAGTVTAIAIGVIVPLPLGMAIGFESPLTQATTVVAWLAGFMLALPPLPIWMAMLYRRSRAAREGEELQAKIAAWQHTTVHSIEQTALIKEAR